MRRSFLLALLIGLVAWPATASDDDLARKIARLRALSGVSGGVAPALASRAVRCGRAGAPSRNDPATRLEVMRAVQDASLRYGVSTKLIRSVIRHESNGHPGAVSHAGAMGLMQLMPGTARELGVRCAFDPRQNIMGGTRYLRELRNRFGSWRVALAAYNAGPARAESGRWPAETKRYVERVLRSWRGS